MSLPLRNSVINDGNFPTIKSPNPEEPSALSMALDLARENGSEIVMATDPDADRLGIAVKKNHRVSISFLTVTRQQLSSHGFMVYLSQKNSRKQLKGDEYIIKNNLFTSNILDVIASKAGG